MGRRRRCRAKTSSGDLKGRDPQEWTKLVFDYYKHLATLNGVSVAVMLTVYRQEIMKVMGLPRCRQRSKSFKETYPPSATATIWRCGYQIGAQND